MPFLTYICTNPTPHKTVVFVPAANLGSNSPGGGGGNPAGGVFPATAGGIAGFITCPQCAFKANAGDGNTGAANGADSNRQEVAISNDTGSVPSGGGVTTPAAGAVESAIRIPVNSPGNLGQLAAKGITTQRLDSAGVKTLI